MSDSGKVCNKTQVRRLRNRRRRRLDMKQMKTLRSTFANGPGGGGDGGDGGGGCGGCVRTKKRRIKGVASCPLEKVPEKEHKIDNFHQLKELMLDTSIDKASPSVSSAYSLAGEDKGGSVTCQSHGLISVIGRRRAMEDAVAVALGITVGEFGVYDFFAVYDGHGGARVANACRDRMHLLVAEEVEKGSAAGGGKGLEYWKKVMGKCFDRMDEEVSGNGEVGEGAAFSAKMMGSTAVVVMVGKEEVVVANCGDSRAVLSRGGAAVPLSRDQKPDRPDERERVEAAGGQVVNWNGSRILGVLATSRSIGDHCLRPYVISEPEVTVTERTESDEFILIATDGLWDVVSNEIACKIVRKSFVGQLKMKTSDEYNGTYAARAAAVLAELATARGGKDNISVIVVDLKKSNSVIS